MHQPPEELLETEGSQRAPKDAAEVGVAPETLTSDFRPSVVLKSLTSLLEETFMTLRDSHLPDLSMGRP